MFDNKKTHGESADSQSDAWSGEDSNAELEALEQEAVVLDLPHYFGEFVMPNLCCSCSQPASGQDSLKRWLNPIKVKDEWSLKGLLLGQETSRPRVLRFPLCPQCIKLFSLDTTGIAAGIVGVFLVESHFGFELTVLVLGFLAVLAKWTGGAFRLLPELKALSLLRRRQAVSRGVQVAQKRSSIALGFSNGLFGYHFCRLNGIRGLRIVEGDAVAAAIERYWKAKETEPNLENDSQGESESCMDSEVGIESEAGRPPDWVPPIPLDAFTPTPSASGPAIPPPPPGPAPQGRAPVTAVPDYLTDPELLDPEPSSVDWAWHIPWVVGLGISVPLLVLRNIFRDHDYPGLYGGATLGDIFIALIVTFSPFVAVPLLLFSLAYVGIPLVSMLLLRKPANTYDKWRGIVPEDEDEDEPKS